MRVASVALFCSAIGGTLGCVVLGCSTSDPTAETPASSPGDLRHCRDAHFCIDAGLPPPLDAGFPPPPDAAGSTGDAAPPPPDGGTTDSGVTEAGPPTATPLFRTDFSPSSFRLDTPLISSDNAGANQNFESIDPNTGAWGPVTVLGTTQSAIQMIVGQQIAPTITDYLANEIQQVAGPQGNQVSALHQLIKDNSPAINSTGFTQDNFQLYRGGAADTGDVYFSYWFMYQSDLKTQLTRGGNGNWRVLTEFKTSGDYRAGIIVIQDDSGNLSWHIQGDNNANGDPPAGPQTFWHIDNTTVPVPVGEWFKFELFWHRGTNGGTDGRYWAAVDGQVIADHQGAMYPEYPNNVSSPAPIDRIMLANAYTGGSDPIEQWVTDLQIWDGFPCGVGLSCYNQR